MTDVDLPSGTDRLAQAARWLGLDDQTVVVNVQGDEPLIDPALIDALADCSQNNPDAAIATAATALHRLEDHDNPNIVKVVCDPSGRALYFSRAPIPYQREQVPGLRALAAHRHLCLSRELSACFPRTDARLT